MNESTFWVRVGVVAVLVTISLAVVAVWLVLIGAIIAAWDLVT